MLQLTYKLLAREMSHPALRLVVLTLTIGLASVQIIQISTDRYLNALRVQAQLLLGADIELRSSRPIEQLDLSALEVGQFDQAERISFPSMVFANEDLRLSNIRAISNGYPLRGNYLVRQSDSEPAKLQAPQPGELWIDEQLLHALNLQLGQQVEVAGLDLRLSGVVLEGPGLLGSFASFAPTAIINIAELDGSDLLASGSRVRYRVAFSSDQQSTRDQIYQALEAQLQSGQRLQRAEDSDTNLGDAIQRARAFFYLSGCLSLLIAILSALLAISHYQSRQQQFVAIVKTLGLGPQRLRRLYLLQVSLLALAAITLGTALAETGHQLLVAYIRRFYQIDLPPAQLSSYLWGVLSLALSLALVVVPKLSELVRTPAWLVLRSGNGSINLKLNKLQVGAAIFCAFALAWLYSRSLWLSLSFTGVVLLLGLISLASYWLVLKYLRPRLPRSPEFNVAAASLRANWRLNALQCAAFTVCAFLVFTILLVRFALVSDWQRQVPVDAPNYFLINIASEQRDELRKFWDTPDSQMGDMYAIVRGRLQAVNGLDMQQRAEELNLEHDSLRRELNFSWSKDVPEGNVLLQGDWWPVTWDAELPPVSIERETFDELQLELGDVISIDIAGSVMRARIISVREVDWGNLRPNFYFLFPPGVLDNQPRSFIASARIASSRLDLLPEFYRGFPAVSLISIEEIVQRLRNIISQIAQAVEGILLLISVSMALLLTAALRIMRQRRQHDLAVLRVLGMRAAVFVRALRWEFLFLTTVAGLLALLLSEAMIAVLVWRVFGNQPEFHWWLWLVGMPGMWSLGLILAQMARRRLQMTPAQMLRS